MDFKSILIILCTLLYSFSAAARLKDPTRPADYSADKTQTFQQNSDLKLSSIWSSGSSKRVSINGVSAKQGDVILSDIKVIKIYADAVLIKQNGANRKLYLLTSSIKSPQKNNTQR